MLFGELRIEADRLEGVGMQAFGVVTNCFVDFNAESPIAFVVGCKWSGADGRDVDFDSLASFLMRRLTDPSRTDARSEAGSSLSAADVAGPWSGRFRSVVL